MIVNAVIMYLSCFSFLTANTILHASINILKNFSKMNLESVTLISLKIAKISNKITLN